MPYPVGFYVYGLVDPRTKKTFYIGKGQGKRAWQHEWSVKAGESSGNERKDKVIREIHKFGGSVEVEILADYDDEDDAFQHEYELIESMTGLTNLVPGGAGGTNGRRLTSKEIRKRSKERAIRPYVNARKAQIEKHDNELERLVKSYRSDKFQKNQDEINQWIASEKPQPLDPTDVLVRRRKDGKIQVKLRPEVAETPYQRVRSKPQS